MSHNNKNYIKSREKTSLFDNTALSTIPCFKTNDEYFRNIAIFRRFLFIRKGQETHAPQKLHNAVLLYKFAIFAPNFRINIPIVIT